MQTFREGTALRGLATVLAVFGVGFVGHIVLHASGWHNSATFVSWFIGLIAFSFPMWVVWTSGMRFLDQQAVAAWYMSSVLGFALAASWLWGYNGQEMTFSLWVAALFSPISSLFVYPFLLPEPLNSASWWGGKAYVSGTVEEE